MRIAVRTAQYLVAILFIVSGLVKANDPLGLAYKMQEFFELWNSSLKAGSFFAKAPLLSLFDFLHGHTLALSVIMIALEIVAGVALLAGWSRRFIIWFLLLLIIFFTFLTGYAYLSGRFTNCGCFGDCLPITPLASFLKDLALLALSLLLLAGVRHVKQSFTAGVRTVIVFLSLLTSLALQWYVLKNLPLVDCLPFKEGNSIPEQLKPPPGSVPDSIAMRFIYEKDGKRYEFAPDELPADFTTYKYIDRIDKVVRKGNAEPPVKGFNLYGLSGADSTEVILTQPRAFALFANDVHQGAWLQEVKTLVSTAAEKNIPVYVVSASSKQWMPVFARNNISPVSFFNVDFTVVRTVARTNPTLLYLEQGKIIKKYSEPGLDNAVSDLKKGAIKP